MLSVDVTANWADLPPDLLQMISDFCILPDYIRMESVCKSWRSILKESRRLPWLMMRSKEGSNARDFLSLSKKKIHTVHLPEMEGKRCWGSFKNGWLLLLGKKDICLFHPWSRAQTELPNLFTFHEGRWSLLYNASIFNIRKAALSDDGKVVVVLCGFGKLGFCRIGDKTWTLIDKFDGDEESLICDAVHHKGQFYALNKAGGLFHVPCVEGGILERLNKDLGATGVFYLVPDTLTDRMFVIVRKIDDFSSMTIHFDIYKTPSILRGKPNTRLFEKLIEVKSLGDRVLFLGCNAPMILMAKEFPGFRGNRIYFTNNCTRSKFSYQDELHYCEFSDSGVFNVDDGTVQERRFHLTTPEPAMWTATPPYSSPMLGRTT